MPRKNEKGANVVFESGVGFSNGANFFITLFVVFVFNFRQSCQGGMTA